MEKKRCFGERNELYAYMQAVGLVNDHLADCWCYS